MTGYLVRYRTEVTMEQYVEAASEEEAIQKAMNFETEHEPVEIEGGGFSELDVLDVSEQP
jgi:macrodomain Ter protein organizer (MatP/YcbG family)